MFPRLYVIIDAALLRTEALDFARWMAESGVKLIQYRNKQIPSRRLFEISRELQSLLLPYGVRFVVNDRADVAAACGAGGVHVGQEDIPVEAARQICGPKTWIGLSTHSLEQVRAAERTAADYLAVGPIFSTQTKETPDPVVGVEFIHKARGVTTKPLVAIGGITLERARSVYAAGADSLAVARDLACADDPGARAREYLALAEEAKRV